MSRRKWRFSIRMLGYRVCDLTDRFFSRYVNLAAYLGMYRNSPSFSTVDNFLVNEFGTSSNLLVCNRVSWQLCFSHGKKAQPIKSMRCGSK
ncbi:unnamed protein product [Periconia digitata]|uniref:Uncharacterized protein n=1 Tax=Periconia digitata TaxID=1303443 RepID=A0A9W4UPT8_9PLEO|nr:unnamed protein product [Periconia digitata]